MLVFWNLNYQKPVHKYAELCVSRIDSVPLSNENSNIDRSFTIFSTSGQFSVKPEDTFNLLPAVTYTQVSITIEADKSLGTMIHLHGNKTASEYHRIANTSRCKHSFMIKFPFSLYRNIITHTAIMMSVVWWNPASLITFPITRLKCIGSAELEFYL